jgi:hypothetical protein
MTTRSSTTSRATTSSSRERYPAGAPTLRTAAGHRDVTQMLRRQGTPKVVELAEQHELLARWIEHRRKGGGACRCCGPQRRTQRSLAVTIFFDRVSSSAAHVRTIDVCCSRILHQVRVHFGTLRKVMPVAEIVGRRADILRAGTLRAF